MKAIVINQSDNVAIVLQNVGKGEEVIIGEKTISAVDDIPYTHKIALTNLEQGTAVIKYGEVIATASKDIRKGEWVHVHNLEADGLD